MYFSDLYELLLRRLRRMICNGALTERGLARRVGISQSHIHNVLHGARVLTANTADRILVGLQLSVADLIRDDSEAAPKRPPREEQAPGRYRGPRRQSVPN
ncbi:MAG: helix-turn-helix transcriptional regulator [bacterium]|nr:helix-turn-helix transcriptional regulator [bacterium]